MNEATALDRFRIASVPYLNAAPLTHGLDEPILWATPSRLAKLLQSGQADAALVSITEVLFNGQYDILDEVAIGSMGEVKSVLLAHRRPLTEVKEVYCDTASLTSVNLLRVLLAERGLHPKFKPLPSYEAAPQLDYVMLIGDEALNFLFAGHDHEIMDLGLAWFEMTRLPFVFAVWALRRYSRQKELGRLLREAKDFGLDVIDHIISTRTDFTSEFRKDYFTWHIQYHLGADEKRGIARFVELLRKHTDQPVFEPRYVCCSAMSL